MQTNTKNHTPGPWEIDATYPEQSKKIHPVGSTIGVAIAFGDDEEETEANARLIASAPDLLSALQEVEDWILRDEEALDFGQVAMSSQMLNERFQNVRAAIAKATGEASK